MSQFSKWDIGACGCGCGDCYPCALPNSSLTATNVITGWVITMNYMGNCLWDSGVVGVDVNTCIRLTMKCTGSCTYFLVENRNRDLVTGSCAGVLTKATFYDHPVNCSGFTAPGSLSLRSFTCSPLSIHLGTSVDVWVITP
jgi:hypothetical protein